MSFDRIEEHRDLVAGLEYEASLYGDLCQRCHENAALPDDPDGFCADCAADVEEIMSEVEEAAA